MPDPLVGGLILQFTTDYTLYYKNPHMFQLDADIGDIHSLIADREIEIIQELRDYILENKRELELLYNGLCEWDALLSLSIAARERGFVRPVVNDSSDIVIVNGRHPILETVIDNFIPNSTHLTDDAHSLVLTGANFSGKTAYLIQTALIVVMAQIGSFVPATSATIGVVDKILVRLSTHESISRPSTFMIDLLQTATALRTSTSSSLVLLDEFGKGTCSFDGIGLFCAVISDLSLRGIKVIAATHFHEVFGYELLDPLVKVSHLTMSIMTHASSPLTFLYKLVPATAETVSFGVHVAGMAGLPQPLLDRAKECADAVLKGQTILLCEFEAAGPAKEIVDRFLVSNLDGTDKGLWSLVAQHAHHFQD